jgi:mycoredoxin
MSEQANDRIDLYWRPGCGFCSSLRRGLDKRAIERVEHDIWSDPHAATLVRSVANGSETVPTVVIGGIDDIGSIGLVNPSAKQVVATLREHAPHLLPDDLTQQDAQSEGGLFGRLVERVRGG